MNRDRLPNAARLNRSPPPLGPGASRRGHGSRLANHRAAAFSPSARNVVSLDDRVDMLERHRHDLRVHPHEKLHQGDLRPGTWLTSHHVPPSSSRAKSRRDDRHRGAPTAPSELHGIGATPPWRRSSVRGFLAHVSLLHPLSQSVRPSNTARRGWMMRFRRLPAEVSPEEKSTTHCEVFLPTLDVRILETLENNRSVVRRRDPHFGEAIVRITRWRREDHHVVDVARDLVGEDLV